MTSVADRSAPGAMHGQSPAALTGLTGLAVLAVVLQSSGGFGVELLGPDLVLAATGFGLTFTLLAGAVGGTAPALAGWYRAELALRLPLLLLTIIGVVLVAAIAGPAATTVAAITGLVPEPIGPELVPDATRADRIVPLGAMWLVAMLGVFGLLWPALLLGLCRLVRATDRRRVLTCLSPVLLAGAAGAWLLGVWRGAIGAGAAELALGPHVRMAEWLIGAWAAAVAVGLRGHPRRVSPVEAPSLMLVGGAVLVAMSVIATRHPVEWLRGGGPGGAAYGAAVVLLAVLVPGEGQLSVAVGHGLPAELGRMAYPLLVLHLPLFWMLHLVVPTARPFALLVIGGAVTWMLGLLLQDGIIRRWQARGTRIAVGPCAGALAVAVALGAVTVGDRVQHAAAPDALGAPRTPVVLVLGGSAAGDLADALERGGSTAVVVDGSRTGCGLLATPAPTVLARTTTQAQAAATLQCGDWRRQWRHDIAAAAPEILIVDLSADAVPRDAITSGGSPCDPDFRPRYRALIAEALDVWTDAAPSRPVLLTTARSSGPATAEPTRCLNALISEAAGTHREIVALDVRAQLCPEGTCREYTLAGERLFDGGRLSREGLAELGGWLAVAVSVALDGQERL